MAKIVFDPKLSHVLGFRHGPRNKIPPVGSVWDYYMMLSGKAAEIAQRTVSTYFPDLVPAALRCSQIPRSAQTLGLLWPDLVPQIKLDRRLGIEFEDVGQWAAIDQFDNAYDMTPQRQYELCPALIDKCGHNFLATARDLVATMGIGKVGAMCSHMPIADCGARFARLSLGITEGDGWLPGSGFGSGAFVHLTFGLKFAGELGPEYVLTGCTYYPVPPK